MEEPFVPGPPADWQAILARQLSDVFRVEGWELRKKSLHFQGRLLIHPEEACAILSARLGPMGYTPQLLREDEVVLLRLAPLPRLSTVRQWALPAALFLATVLSTFLIGGLAYSASLMAILLVHELGHYVTARRYGMRVSPPFFIPLPLPPLGTMGAIIRMRSPMPNRRVIFDVGIAGPLAGLCVALPLTVLGLFLSRIVPQLPEDAGVLQFGEPLLFKVLARLILGPVPEGATILAHPIAFAGWVGFFVTALNLVPAGQLDGGHVTYAMLGRRHDKVALLAVLALFGMTGYTLFSASPNFSWAAIGGLLLSFGYRHPPPLNDLTPLDPWRRRLGVLTCGLFVTLFTPVPIVF